LQHSLFFFSKRKTTRSSWTTLKTFFFCKAFALPSRLHFWTTTTRKSSSSFFSRTISRRRRRKPSRFDSAWRRNDAFDDPLSFSSSESSFLKSLPSATSFLSLILY
jgi:hypothetical protein